MYLQGEGDIRYVVWVKSIPVVELVGFRLGSPASEPKKKADLSDNTPFMAYTTNQSSRRACSGLQSHSSQHPAPRRNNKYGNMQHLQLNSHLQVACMPASVLPNPSYLQPLQLASEGRGLALGLRSH